MSEAGSETRERGRSSNQKKPLQTNKKPNKHGLISKFQQVALKMFDKRSGIQITSDGRFHVNGSL